MHSLYREHHPHTHPHHGEGAVHPPGRFDTNGRTPSKLRNSGNRAMLDKSLILKKWNRWNRWSFIGRI